VDNRGVGHDFEFNGWGGKYHYEGDVEVGALLADKRRMEVQPHDWVLEGG
ncbi:agmatine deiminase family protein, partial [Enterobacter hormaechei]